MNTKSMPADSAQLLAKIRAEIGDAACESPDQCHSIGIGAKACGGPEAYLAWSSLRSDGETLRNLVAQHRAAREEENLRSGILSDCRVVPDPGASCVPRAGGGGGHCRLIVGGVSEI
jgi:hypothetical protein